MTDEKPEKKQERRIFAPAVTQRMDRIFEKTIADIIGLLDCPHFDAMHYLMSFMGAKCKHGAEGAGLNIESLDEVRDGLSDTFKRSYDAYLKPETPKPSPIIVPKRGLL